MTERHSRRRHHMSAPERQMLVAAYLPVITSATVLIAAWALSPGVKYAVGEDNSPHADRWW